MKVNGIRSFNESCEICTGMVDDTYLIYETKHWKVFPNPDQHYLGRSVVIAKNHNIPTLPTLIWHPFMALDYFRIAGKFEQAVSQEFNANGCNWMSMMNYAYRNDPPNPHLHFHVYPRYPLAVEFAGLVFEDKEFGSFVSREKRIVSEQTRLEIAQALRTYF